MAGSPLFPALDRSGGRAALTVGERTLSYAELRTACDAIAGRLTRAGLRPGDRVAVWTQRDLATPVALLANALSGFVSIPLNPALGSVELDHILRDSEPKVALAADLVEVAGRAPALPLEQATVETEGATRAFGVRVTRDPMLILYTSGTTGPPKGAVLSVRNVAANLDALAQAWAWTEADTVVHALPLFHVHGLVLGLFGSIRVGGRLTWVPRFSPAGVAEALGRGGTMLFAVPTMIRRLTDAASEDAEILRALKSARLLISGSAALPRREHARIESLCGRRVIERYGLTETIINCAVPHDAPMPGYVGPPLEGIDLKLVDDERNTLAARDDATIGEVAVRGPNVFLGYLNRPGATRAVMDEAGWFYTGDLATRTAEGVIRIVGRRATDLIKTGGFKVGAGEVESALLEHVGVSEVAVLGVPDEDLGERIIAFVVPSDPAAPPEPDELSEHVANALAPYKRPREVRFLEALPRNAMGKVQKGRLRDLL